MTWVAVVALALLCVLMRVAVPLGLGDRRPPGLERALERALPALLAALVVTGAATNGQRLTADPRLAGVAAACAAIAARAPMLVALLLAAGVAAGLRAL